MQYKLFQIQAYIAILRANKWNEHFANLLLRQCLYISLRIMKFSPYRPCIFDHYVIPEKAAQSPKAFIFFTSHYWMNPLYGYVHMRHAMDM